MKNFISSLVFIFAISATSFAQVGVGNTSPKSKIEISASSKSNPSITDGLLVPRIDVLPSVDPGADQDGMLIFLTTSTSTHKKGHHYWDNTQGEWEYFAGEWVDGYNSSNGDLTYVKQAFKESQQDVVILDTGKMGMGTDAPDESLEIKLPGDNDIQISSNGSIPNAPNLIYYTKGGSFASPTFLTNNEPVGSIAGSTWTGSGESGIIASVTSLADGNHSSGNLPTKFNFSVTGNGDDSEDDNGVEMTIKATGKIGIGNENPTAYLHLKASDGSANAAPLKFNAGTNLTTTERGAFEFDGTHLYFTPGATRQILLKTLTNTATLDFLILFAGLHTEQTVSVPGATPGSSCNCAPVGSIENGLSWSCYVSAANTVTIRLSNITGGAIDPVSKNWVVTVIE